MQNKPVKLTPAQAETLELLYGNGFGSCPNPDDALTFTARRAFPERDNQSNGARRCITALAAKGVIEHLGSRYGEGDIYRCTATTYQTYQAWMRQRDAL